MTYKRIQSIFIEPALKHGENIFKFHKGLRIKFVNKRILISILVAYA